MPRLTATATRSSIAGNSPRRAIVFKNQSGGATVYWGWEDTITGSESSATCGVPLAAGDTISLYADTLRNGPLYFITAGGTAYVFYTQN